MDIEVGRKDQDYLYAGQDSSSSVEDYSNKSLLNNPNLRIQFVRKVYSILSTQLLLTAFMAYLAMTNPAIGSYVLSSPATFAITIIVSIVILVAMVCNQNLSRIVPTNYILLGTFTFCEAYMVSFICATFSWTEGGEPYYEGRELVYMAAILTIGVTISITLYAYTTKTDFTILSGLLFMLISIAILASLLLFFYSIYALEIVVCSLSALIYGIYIIYDTQLIMGGKSYELTVDDYIIGALMLYVDIIRLFLRILEILAKSKRK